jgi:hypothetical protein
MKTQTRSGTKHASGGVVFLSLLSVLATSPLAWGFQPAVDSAGPLTLRIDGPSEVAKTEAPVAVHAVLENSGEQPLKGRVRLAVIDRWRVTPPDGETFAVDAKGKTTLDFSVTAGEGTYSALYPIHAFAEAEGPDGGLKLHAVLIVETKLPAATPATAPIEWKPVIVPADGGMGLCRLLVRRVIVQVFGKEPIVMPVGWSGMEASTHSVVSPGESIARGAVRDAVVMHPPYLNGRIGTVLIEYPLRLPAGGPIRLRFGNAIRDHRPEAGEPPSDGVTFRVRVLPLEAPAGEQGEVVYEKNSAAKTWLDGEADLTRFAGREIRVQLDSHPGPKNDTSCDQSFWAEPTVVASTLPEVSAFPPLAGTPSRVIGRAPFGDGTCEVCVWPGRRGLLDGTVGFVAGERRLMFHGFQVRVLGDLLSKATSASALVSATEEHVDDGYRVRHHFAGAMGSFDVLGELRVEHGVLRARFRLENGPAPRPWQVARLEDVAAGPWNDSARRVYAGHGNVIVEPEPFTLAFDGHRLSTSFVGFEFGDMKIVQAVDNPPDHLEVDPKSRTYTLHVPHDSTMTFIPASDVWAGVRIWREVNGLHAAGGVRKLAGRFAFDLWGGKYAENTKSLQQAFRYGLTDAVVVAHNWQRWGYDYRLPDICPPNPSLGTLEEFQTLAKACGKAGVLFAPHDNYIDYYPDAEGYSYEHIAFHPDGTPVKAWLNQGPMAQSYRWRTNDMWTPLKRNVRWIRDNLAPTAYFIDVWSSIGPYDEWTCDGKFESRVDVGRTWGEAFAWIRDELGDNAPQISESGHDQLIGRLDGAQTNHLRVVQPAEAAKAGWTVWPIACADAERTAWSDAAHHDRFVLHGAGYPGRYDGGLDRKTHGIYSDDYICTEMLTGHPAMVSQAFGRDVVRKYWLSHDVARALALRQMRGVEFADGDIHRQHVTWEGDGDVWVNRGKTDWTVSGHVLPPFGFWALVKTRHGVVSAAIERQGAVTVEWSRGPGGIYLNARPETNGATATATCGSVSTDGGCRLDVEDGKDGRLRVTPLPGTAKLTVRVNWDELPWKLPRPASAEGIDEQGASAGAAKGAWQAGEFALTCEPGVFAYRMVSGN